MNLITQEYNGNPLGIQTSQLISRNCPEFTTVRSSQSVSDNLNRFIAAHSRTNDTQWKKRYRYNEYLAKDIETKSSSAHQFLCGPLNTKRLTRKSNTFNPNLQVSTHSSNFKHLYGTGEPSKPPWNEPERVEKSRDSGVTDLSSSSENLPLYLEQIDNFKVTVREFVVSSVNELPDGQVPDPIHVDNQDSCPLYDSSEYEKQIQTRCSDENLSSPERDRYGLFVGAELSRFMDHDQLTKVLKPRPKNREEALGPLLTSPNGGDIFITGW